MGGEFGPRAKWGAARRSTSRSEGCGYHGVGDDIGGRLGEEDSVPVMTRGQKKPRHRRGSHERCGGRRVRTKVTPERSNGRPGETGRELQRGPKDALQARRG